MATKYKAKPKPKPLAKGKKAQVIHTKSEREFQILLDKMCADKLPGLKKLQLDE